MNRKEISEIKKNIEIDNDLLIVNSAVIACIDAEKNVKCMTNRSFTEIPREELECIIGTVKNSLSGTLGKALVEYEFPMTAYEEDHAQSILYKALDSKLMDEEAVEKLVDHIREKMDYVSVYTIMITHCTYTVFKKNKTGDEDPYDSFDYSFIDICICPVELRVDGLIYSDDKNAVIRKLDFDKVVAEKPDAAVLYPTFTGRGPDVNHVLCYSRNIKKPNISLVEDVLECSFTSTVNDQKAAFHGVMQEVLGDELNYSFISSVNEKLRDIADNTKNDYDMAEINENDVCNILIGSGVESEKEEAIRTAFKEHVGEENTLPVVNLVENKMQIKSDGIVVTVGKGAIDKVRTRDEDGHRYMLIDLDDPTVTINGMASKL
jgi:hypothetical protein